MKYTFQLLENVLQIELKDDLIEGADLQDFMLKINQYIDQGTIFALVDISNVRYINSSGIGILIRILTKFRNRGGEVILVKPSDHVKKLLIITKLNAIFTIEESSEEALKKLKAM